MQINSISHGIVVLTLKLSSSGLGGMVGTRDWLQALRRWIYHVRAKFLPCAAKDSENDFVSQYLKMERYLIHSIP